MIQKKDTQNSLNISDMCLTDGKTIDLRGASQQDKWCYMHPGTTNGFFVYMPDGLSHNKQKLYS